MSCVRTDFCFLLIGCFMILCLSDCFCDDPDGLVGVVTRWQYPEKLPWGVVTGGYKFGMYTEVTTLPKGVSLKKTWENFNKGYYMKCFEDSRDKEPGYKVSLYYRSSGSENVFLTFSVMNCEDQFLLQSVTISNGGLRNNYCMLLFTDGCKQYKVNRKGDILSETSCKTLSSSQSGVGGAVSRGYLNNWKSVIEEELRTQIEMKSELKNLKNSIPCEEDNPGEVINLEDSEVVAWGIKRRVVKKGFRSQWYDLPLEVELRDAWTNRNRGGYFMKCYENLELKKFRAIIYDQPGKSIRPLVTIAVTSCDPKILNSITMMPYQISSHTLMLQYQNSCCKKYVFNYKDKLKVVSCPPKNKRSSKNNDSNYINSWKKVSEKELDTMINEKATKEEKKRRPRLYLANSSDSSSRSG